MFIAMNRFQVKVTQADAFQKLWAERESHLSEIEGFIRFNLLRGPVKEGAQTLEFVSHSTWLNEKSFMVWVHSESFKKAHGSSFQTRDMLAGPPQFTGYSVVLDEVAGERKDFRSSYLDQLVEKHFAHESEAQKELKRWAEEEGLPAIRIGAYEGRLLELLLRASGAKRGVEIGTLGGYSASWLLRALPEDGKLITLELDADRAAKAQAKLNELGYLGRVEVLAGNARETLNEKLSDIKDLDFVFIDADKASYAHYVEWALPRLRKGGLILIDNAYLWGGMNYFGRDEAFEKDIGGYSKAQFEGMSACWKQLAYNDAFAGLILPTGEGLGLAIKL
jgi:predicted O-methyltransferase YrrM/heme-degrading monooxygenase HmoA